MFTIRVYDRNNDRPAVGNKVQVFSTASCVATRKPNARITGVKSTSSMTAAGDPSMSTAATSTRAKYPVV